MIRWNLLLLLQVVTIMTCFSLSQEERDKGFVYLHEVDPTILVSLRYATDENFVGSPVDGYKKPFAIVTKQTAEALRQAQEELKKDGFSLVVYDAYRPQRAVNHLMRWANEKRNQIKKVEYYPYVNKNELFRLHYIAERSGHSRGSTVDVTIMKDGEKLKPIERSVRRLLDGRTITFLDDGTVDMGSSFDLFDKASHSDNDFIAGHHKKKRDYLKMIMVKYGFKPYSNEWWHFRFAKEPFNAEDDSSYFDFEIE